jgi:hypothetical protein
VKDLEHAGVGHQRQQRSEVDAGRQRIDERRLVRPGDLHQAELRPVGLVAHEFGVDGDEIGPRLGVAEGGERGGRLDNLHGRPIHRKLPSANWATRAASPREYGRVGA